ncbi:golgin IMH1-like [Actinia tenebrosa]|uniref:Golgin IMH1-like n=1 Tax=Actinia tenebrosa TaxID=6105 RepID=A0A6P8IVY1_ACTTE|nr:golgin IMH1-like [Actinia tenebrosa]
MSGRARDPNDDIEELRQKVRNNEIKIAELEQQLQKADEKTKELEDEKKALEKEVDEHKKKIKWLEDEVRYFSTKPAITNLRGEIEEKNTQIVSIQHTLNAFMCQMAEKDKRLDTMEKMVQKYMAETDELKTSRNRMEEDIKYFTKKSQEKEEDLNKYMAKTDKLEKSQKLLYIGQLCAKAMEAMYREVLPVYFERGNDYKQPHLRDIDAKIKQLCETGDAQRAAQRRWEKLQTEKIDPDENNVKKLVDFMEEMLAERNEVAHPCPLNEKELKDIASKLPGQKQQLVEKVIQISKEMMPTIFLAF